MQQHNEVGSSYYQYYQSHFQNPNPIDPPPPDSSFPNSYASAPPVSSIVSSSDGYSNYSSNYPIPNQESSGVFHQPYSVPHPMPHYPYYQNHLETNFDSSNSNPRYDPNLISSSSYYPYDQNQTTVSYGGFRKEPIGEGVYAYNGGRPESSTALTFDDYGRPLSLNNRNEQNGSLKLDSKIVKAAPKVEMHEDVKNGVQKFRVKLLAEGSGGQSDMDVICQVGLDGIRILDPATSRTLKIYLLETVTRWEVLDSHIFAFWAKSSIDIEARPIRLKSNSYTTSNILDMVAAASIQIKEMGGDTKASDSHQVLEHAAEKKGFADWMNLMKPANEEKDNWVPDEAATKCTPCGTYFGAFVRRHHCRNCCDLFCDKCTQGRIALTAEEHAQPVRVCDRCMAEVTQRLSNAKEVAARVVGFQSHEDLAKKLQEEMDKNRKSSTGMKSHIADSQMREVECPTCTVHLQVLVPASGSETIECSVCQHPFLVSAH